MRFSNNIKLPSGSLPNDPRSLHLPGGLLAWEEPHSSLPV